MRYHIDWHETLPELHAADEKENGPEYVKDRLYNITS